MTMANGKICYIEMPATDIPRTAAFYEKVFGWTIRTRDDGSTSFDDVGEVSGTWTERVSPAAPGLLVHIMVKDAAATLEGIIANGGTVVQPIDPAAGEIVAHFRDPGGNVMGIYQEQGLST
ncbi:VOC family protein [soil metagenome]